jgi:multicomponent Na+:H+ antiporter subunit C
MDFLNVEFFSIILFFISFYGLITSKSIIKSIISIGLMETAVIMFFLSIGFSHGNTPPIGINLENAADPLPQALMITAIITGLAVTAVNLIMFISICRQYKTTDWAVIKEE